MYSNEQRLFWRRGISMEGVGLGLVVGCTGSKESRWEGGKRLGSCKRKMVNIVHVGNSCGTQVCTLSYTHIHVVHEWYMVLHDKCTTHTYTT